MANLKGTGRTILGYGAFVVGVYLLWAVYDQVIGRPNRVPDQIEQTKRSMSEISKSYYTYYGNRNRFPNDLEELYVAFPHLHQRDAWDFKFRTVTRDNRLYVYSTGPDGIDNQGAIEYDCENGAFSAGDILYLIRRLDAPLPEESENP